MKDASCNNNIVDLTLSDEEDVGKKDISFINCKLLLNQKQHPNNNLLKTLSIANGKLDLETSPTLPPDVSVSLQTDSIDQKQICPKEIRIKLPKITSSVPEIPMEITNESQKDSCVVDSKPNARYGLRTRAPAIVNVVPEKKPKIHSKRNGNDTEKPPALEQSWEWSTSATARQFDIKHNFFPEPGPSHVNYYEHMDLSVYYNPQKQIEDTGQPPSDAVNGTAKRKNGVKIGPKLKLKPPTINNCAPSIINTLLRPPTFDYVLDAMPNYGIPYCFDASINNNKTDKNIVDDFRSDIVPGKGWLAKRNHYQTAIDKQKKSPVTTTVDKTILETLLRPPTFDEVYETMPAYDLPYCESTEPFYSDSKDATARKEISHSNVLHIPTQTLDSLEHFRSDIVEIRGFVETQNDFFKKICGTEKLISHADIRCKLASNTVLCTILPSKVSPTYAEAKLWMESTTIDSIEIDLLADSPIKIRRISHTIAIDDDGDEAGVILKMSQLTPNDITDEHVIEASPTSKINGKPNHRDVTRVRKQVTARKPSPILFENSPDSRNGNSTNDVICVDDDDEVVVCPDMDTSQLFAGRPKAKDAVGDGNVLVSKC